MKIESQPVGQQEPSFGSGGLGVLPVDIDFSRPFSWPKAFTESHIPDTIHSDVSSAFDYF